MTIIQHDSLPLKRTYTSKVYSRSLVNADMGAETITIWEQIIPAGGFILPHYHNTEETLTFLEGRIEVQMGDEFTVVTAPVTVFIRPGLIHGVKNPGPDPARVIAVFPTNKPQVLYHERPQLAEWGDDEPHEWTT